MARFLHRSHNKKGDLRRLQQSRFKEDLSAIMASSNEMCRHGCPEMNAKERDERLVLLGELGAMMNAIEATGPGDSRARTRATAALSDWCTDRSAMLDMDMVKFCFGESANIFLLRDDELLLEACRTIFTMGIRLEAMLDIDSSKEESAKSLKRSQEIKTRRGLLLHVQKKIPCRCLDEKKKNAKETTPKMVLCANASCPTLGQNFELKKCLRCLSVKYCSRKCQKADWPQHKRGCRHVVK